MDQEYIAPNGLDRNSEEWSAFDPERLITVTFFPSQCAPSKAEKQLSLEGLAELIGSKTAESKGRQPCLKLAAFSGIPNPSSKSNYPSVRYDAGVVSLSGIEGDYDGGEVSIAEAAYRLRRARLRGLLYPSASSTPEKPRWRVLAFFAHEFAGDETALREYRNKMLNRLNGVLDGVLTGESWTLSQAFYFGGVGTPIEATIVEGDCVDERDDLDAGRMGSQGKVTNHGSRNGKQPLGDDEGDDNASNVAKARAYLKNVDPLTRGYVIACGLRRDIGLTWATAVELWSDRNDELDWPWDPEKIESCCRNAGLYGNGDQGQFGGAGADAYSTEVIPASLVEQIRNSAPPGIPEDAPAGTESAMATHFAARFHRELHFVHRWGWMSYDGVRWKRDEMLSVWRLAKRIADEQAWMSQKESERRKLASKTTINAIADLARSDPRIITAPDAWDSRPDWFNTPAGMVDLTSGELRGSQWQDLVTKVASTGPGGSHLRWLKFIEEVSAGDRALAWYLQKLAGYCLTGSIKEHALFLLHGVGANGKSVFLNTLNEICGDYARVAPADIFVDSQNERHPTDMAMLRGARLVTAQEIEDGKYWAEAKLKMLTGGDLVTARFMRQDNFTYAPQFKLLIAANHKPRLRNVDEAIRRRLHLIPFSHHSTGET
jgi:hypothetical protein